jgi:hypothetical protein
MALNGTPLSRGERTGWEHRVQAQGPGWRSCMAGTSPPTPRGRHTCARSLTVNEEGTSRSANVIRYWNVDREDPR